MKKIYLFALLAFVITGCSKDFLKNYNTRIEGKWRLADVDRRGLGGSLNNLTFTEGEFVFGDGGRLTYTNGAGTVYQGSWNIRRYRDNDCFTDENGNQNCDNDLIHTLSITAVDFAGQDIKTEHFERMVFTGTDRFKAYIYSGLHTYVFYFKR